MKKVMFFLLLVPLMTVAQDRSERGILEVGGKVTVNDLAYASDFDSLAKVGTFAENRVMGQIFFGLSNSQIGIFGSYLSGDILSEKYWAFSFEEFAGGLMFRQSIGCSEIKLGLGYYGRTQRDFGYQELTPFDVLRKQYGLKIPLGVVISQEEFDIFPKLTLSAEQNFQFGPGHGISNWFRDDQVFSMKQYFYASADLSLYTWHFMPEFHFSPLVGVEVGQMTRLEPVFKVGGTVSSNLIRTDVVRFGYFFDTQRTGVEGFFVTLNLAGFFSAF
ncbi:MAG: hypothetical protein PHP37_00395 [Patescibacteria group bacterium]|nr:hypothetical protein [Patescibacteria group bacterium]